MSCLVIGQRNRRARHQADLDDFSAYRERSGWIRGEENILNALEIHRLYYLVSETDLTDTATTTSYPKLVVVTNVEEARVVVVYKIKENDDYDDYGTSHCETVSVGESEELFEMDEAVEVGGKDENLQDQGSIGLPPMPFTDWQFRGKYLMELCDGPIDLVMDIIKPTPSRLVNDPDLYDCIIEAEQRTKEPRLEKALARLLRNMKLDKSPVSAKSAGSASEYLASRHLLPEDTSDQKAVIRKQIQALQDAHPPIASPILQKRAHSDDAPKLPIRAKPKKQPAPSRKSPGKSFALRPKAETVGGMKVTRGFEIASDEQGTDRTILAGVLAGFGSIHTVHLTVDQHDAEKANKRAPSPKPLEDPRSKRVKSGRESGASEDRDETFS